jgi:hypothetical protein
MFMQAVARRGLIVAFTLALAGCYGVIKTPGMTSAAVYGPQLAGGALTAQQVAQLSQWVRAHDAGWRGLMRAPPASVSMAIVMHEPGGRQSTLDLFVAGDGSAMAYFYAPSPARPLERYLQAADVAALRAAVGH